MNDISFLRPLPIGEKIRLGNPHDGGYVVYKRLLNETDALITYGIGQDISFEEDFNRLTTKRVFMFDPTIVGKYLVDLKVLKGALLKLQFKAAWEELKKGWSLWNLKRQLRSKGIFFVNEGIAASVSDKYNTFDHHLERFGLNGKRLILKIDIEAAEYEIFQDKRIFNYLRHVNQLIIEVHDLKNRLPEWKDIATELSENFELVHLHGNNYEWTFRISTISGKEFDIPNVMEFLFVRKTLINADDIISDQPTYPIAGLDFPNNPKREDHEINFI